MQVNVDLRLFPDGQRLMAEMTGTLCGILAHRQKSGGVASLVCTGGSMGTLFGQRLTELAERNDKAFAEVRWNKVHYWFSDERYVPSGDPERNDGLLDEFFTKMRIPESQIHRVPGPDNSDDVTDAAYAYAERLRSVYPELTERFVSERDERTPIFDVILLGVGPDGHVASLFPDHAGMTTTGVTVPIVDSPKPPKERVSLSMSLLNSAMRVWVLASGGEKAESLASAFVEGNGDLPVAQVQGNQQTIWWLDHAAASRLPRQD